MIQLKLQTANLLLTHSNMTKDFTGVRQQVKSKLRYHLLSHSDHLVTRESALAACTACQKDKASPLLDCPPGEDSWEQNISP